MIARYAQAHATLAHAGVLDKRGVPYIEHPEAVAGMLMFHGEDYQVVAWLHDVWEDTDYVLPLAGHDGPDDERLTIAQEEALDAVTRREGETYKNFIRRIAGAGDIAIQVKLADISHNMSPEREFEGSESLRPRYLWAQEYLYYALT